MKKFICILLAILSISTLLFGCSKNNVRNDTTDDNVFENYNDVNSNTEQEAIYIDSGIVDYENVNLEYNGKPIEFDYKYNSSANCEMGLQLFVNGILQKFSVDGENYNLYKVNCKSNKDEIFHVSFTPNNGTKGETASLIFANIYNPEIIEFKGEVNTFGNYHKISQSMPWGIKMKEDVDAGNFKISSAYEKHKFTKEELNKFIRTNVDGSKTNILNEKMFFDTSKDIERISKNNDKTVTFNLYGNLVGKYRISLYGDFEQININSYNYIDIEVQKNTQYSVSFPIEMIERYKNIYAVAVSLDNTEGLIKSNSYYVE